MYWTFVGDVLKTSVLFFRQIAFERDLALNSVDKAFRLFDAFRTIAPMNSFLS